MPPLPALGLAFVEKDGEEMSNARTLELATCLKSSITLPRAESCPGGDHVSALASWSPSGGGDEGCGYRHGVLQLLEGRREVHV